MTERQDVLDAMTAANVNYRVVDDVPATDVAYHIVDAENPSHNQILPSGDNTTSAEAREQSFQLAAQNVRMKLAAAILRRRAAERNRSLRARVAGRRKKERLAKMSRKLNRG